MTICTTFMIPYEALLDVKKHHAMDMTSATIIITAIASKEAEPVFIQRHNKRDTVLTESRRVKDPEGT